MQVQHSESAKKFLIVVSSAIVYQDMAFSHSLGLHLTAYSVRSCIAPASGSR